MNAHYWLGEFTTLLIKRGHQYIKDGYPLAAADIARFVRNSHVVEVVAYGYSKHADAAGMAQHDAIIKALGDLEHALQKPEAREIGGQFTLEFSQSNSAREQEKQK